MKTKCARQRAFIQKLNYLMDARDIAFRDGDENLFKYYKDMYENFVNQWCPTLKDEYLPDEHV